MERGEWNMSSWSRRFCLAVLLSGPALASAAEHAINAPNLSISNISQNSAQIRWEGIAEASRYELSFGTDENASNRDRKFVSVNSLPLESLTPNTTYRVKVRAIVAGQAMNWSSIQAFSTFIPALNGMEADDIRDTSVHLVWNDQYSDLPDTSYEVSFGTDSDASSDGVRTTDKNFLLLHNLSAETKYYFKLRARNPRTAGPWSQPISVVTRPYSPSQAPAQIRIKSDGPSAVALEWSPVEATSAYDLSYGTDPLAENMGIVPVEKTSFTFSLSPNTRYGFKIRTVNKGIPGPWSAVQFFLTLPAKPRGLSVTSQTADSALLSWDSPPGSQFSRYYRVAWGSDSGASNAGVTTTADSLCLLPGLLPNQTYFARVQTLNATGASAWSDPLSFTTLFGSVSEIVVFDVKHTSAKVRWPVVPDAVQYEVAYGQDLEASGRNLEQVENPPVELKSLMPDTTYYVKVRPWFANQKSGAWSNLISLSTFPVPPELKEIKIVELGGTFIRLDWEETSKISTYEIQYTREDEAGPETKNLVIHRTEARLSPLETNTGYTIQIRGVNLGGPGPWISKPSRVTTFPDTPPQNLKVSNLTPYEAVFSWDAIPGPAAVQYDIRYSAGRGRERTISGHLGTAVGLSPLEPETQYRVRVMPKNSAGQGPWSEELVFTTPLAPPAAAPRGLEARKLTDISAELVWQPMKKVDGYRLSLGTDVDASNHGADELRKTIFPMKGLNPNTNYFVKVKAYNASGEGPWSEILLVTTKTSPPVAAPRGAAVSSVTANSISLGWSPAEDAIAYEVSLGTDPKGENLGIQSTTAVDYVFASLKPETLYSVKVRSVNAGGPGPWSSILKASTKKP